MTEFKGNINNWISNSGPDFYILFIKSWIPFNAWYVNHYESTNDSDIIKKIIEEENGKIKSIIISKLTNDIESNYKFRLAFVDLYLELESRFLSHRKKRVSFKNLSIKSEIPSIKSLLDNENYIYRISKQPGYFHLQIIRRENNREKTYLNLKLNSYNPQELEHKDQFIRLPNRNIKKNIKDLFKYFDSDKSVSVLHDSKSEDRPLIFNKSNKVKFINNPDLLSQALIDVLYKLRCMLFHGEVDPTFTNMSVYENGYIILNTIIKELSA